MKGAMKEGGWDGWSNGGWGKEGGNKTREVVRDGTRRGREGARGGGEGRNKERERGREGRRESARGGREEPIMLGRQRASVKEGRVEGGMVDEGNERGMDGTRHGRQEGRRRRRQFYLKSNKIVKAT